MRSLVRFSVRFILCVAALSGLAVAHPKPFNNLSANPITARILFTWHPLDLHDPQRKVCVLSLAGDVPQASGRALDKRVLKYLREMVRVSRNLRRRDMALYYEEAWEFSAARIYGPLPPQPVYNLRGNSLTELLAGDQSPEDVVSHLAPGTARPAPPWPLRKIVKKFARNWRGHEFTYETLECAHILKAPVGYSIPVKSRRCIYCAADAAARASSRKKPSATVSAIAKAKAVGA